jgi:ADP-ribose pyrophosphatase YjhB (NUDIX family)
MSAPLKKNSFCSYCGKAFAENQAWPRTCIGCTRITYQNPIPVSVVLLPVDGGLLTIRREIDPKKGQLALPGGFIDLGESWQQAGAREVREETGYEISPDEIQDFRVLSAPDGTVLVFGEARARRKSDLPAFTANAETSECVVVDRPQELAFPLHTRVVAEWFARKR